MLRVGLTASADLLHGLSCNGIIQLSVVVMQCRESPQQPAELLRGEGLHVTHCQLGNVVQQRPGPPVSIAGVVSLGQRPNHIHHAACI